MVLKGQVKNPKVRNVCGLEEKRLFVLLSRCAGLSFPTFWVRMRREESRALFSLTPCPLSHAGRRAG
jgi:hypothetical protein